MVVVLEGEECESRKGPVETASKTNNVGEVMAVQQAIRWAVEQGQSVKIRYDSKYAANMVQGTWKCKKGRNIELIREAREEYRKATREVNITWEHVKAHSNHKWNDRADALADEGAQMSHGTHAKWSRGEQASQDSEEPLKESEACTKGGVRWVTYRPTETRRVLRSRTRHGCLNRSATKQRNIPRGEIERLASIAIKEILGEGRTGLADTREATKAIAKIKQAASDMRDTKIQKEERRARRKPIHTREIWCAVNTITITITIKILLLQLYASCETALRHPSCPRRKLRIVPSEKQKTSSRAAAHGKAQPHPQHGTKTRETQLHPRSPNHPEGASKHANDQASPQPKATPPTTIKQLSTEKSLILSWRPP